MEKGILVFTIKYILPTYIGRFSWHRFCVYKFVRNATAPYLKRLTGQYVFFIYGLTLLFKVEPPLNLPLIIPVSNLIGSTIYGLVIAWA